jgi:hypothetical protein
MSTPYPPFVDPVAVPEQEVRYSYWPVSYQFGDPTVISAVPLPLGGVQYSEVMRGVGTFKASLQLADEDVRALYPWDKVIPRKTGIVVVREIRDPVGQNWLSEVVQHYTVDKASPGPHDGRMMIEGTTVEARWARRLITKAITWTNVDQVEIAADLLDPALFSLIPLGANPWPGWITVDPPTTATGVLRTFAYEERQETNLLEAHQNRSQLATNSYEWMTKPTVLVGDDAASASVFRVQYVMAYPRLGRALTDDNPVPRLTYDTRGIGNVLQFERVHDGSNVQNIVWGRGNGYEALQVKALATNPEWVNGFLQSEGRFSDPDVKEVSTLESYCYRQIWQSLSSEQFIARLTLAANKFPYFGSYVIGDEMILETNDITWPPDLYNDDGYVELLVRVYGWTVTPPQAGQSETVELLVAGGTL